MVLVIKVALLILGIFFGLCSLSAKKDNQRIIDFASMIITFVLLFIFQAYL